MRYLLCLIIALTLFSCQNESSNKTSGIDSSGIDLLMEEEIEQTPRSTEPPPPPAMTLEKGSKIIKKGNMKFQVNNPNRAKVRVDSMLKSLNGYYEEERYDVDDYKIGYQLKIRLPNLKFDSLILLLEKSGGIGKLLNKRVNTEDVTTDYVDLNIRLENNLSYLQQYKTILTKAKSIKEILEVQEKIRAIEEEIESKKGRIRYIDDQVQYSSLDLYIVKWLPSKPLDNTIFSTRVANAFQNGIAGFLSFIVFLVNIWIILVFLLLLFFLRKPILNKIK